MPLRRGEVDQDFDQEELAKLLDQGPFNVAIADLYRSRFKRVPGVVYTAGVKHANNVAAAMREFGINARAVSGETPKRELAETLAAFERGEVDVLCNAMLLAEGWNSPRATICMHLAPTASQADLPAARRPRHPPQPGQGGGAGDRPRPPGDPPRRDDRDPALAARPRRLPRRRDRRRPGPPRPRPPGPGREARRSRSPPIPSAACRCSSGRCGERPSSASTTPSSTSGPPSPAPACSRTPGARPRRCSSTTRPRSCAAASCSPASSATARPSSS